MRLLIVPDLHENLDFLRYIIAVEDSASYDKIVFLGDYFDPPTGVEPDEGRLREVAGTIIGLKEILGDKLHLLCGNHDLPYYALRPACGANRGRPNRVLSNWIGRTSHARAGIVNEVWDEAFWRQLEGPVLLDGCLYSHAGVSPDWWPAELASTGERARWLARQWRSAFESIFVEAEPTIFAAGKARGGVLPRGGPIWLDFDHEFEDALEVPQIVGHTRCARRTPKGRSYCIDFAQAAYAVVEAGEVQLRIWPESWLGEAVLDDAGA